jgi:hypothetical protein
MIKFSLGLAGRAGVNEVIARKPLDLPPDVATSTVFVA